MHPKNEISVSCASVLLFRPFFWTESDYTHGTFATEAVETVFNTAAIEYDLSHHLWSDAYSFTLKTANTCLYSTIHTEERESTFEWIGEFTELNTSLYAKAGSNITLDSLEDAKQYSVTVMKNDFFQEYLLELGFIENQNLYVSNSHDTLMSLLPPQIDCGGATLHLVYLSVSPQIGRNAKSV